MKPQPLSMAVMKTIKRGFIGFLDSTRLLGSFNHLTRNGLRILCYHGFSMLDLHEWCPGVFMRKETFRQRMRFLKKYHFHVLGLEEAIRLLKEGRLPDLSAVITMDDGWSGVGTVGHAICKEFGFPYTVYLSSYHSKKRSPVFNMAVRYFFWKTKKPRLDLDELGLSMKGTRLIGNASIKSETEEKIIDYGKTRINDELRVELLEKLARCLDIDYEPLKAMHALEFLNSDEIAALSKEGVDFQLHTHRHHFPMDEKVIEREIAQNREYLEPIVNKSLNHFCYPSGIWQPGQLPYLKKLNIETATTCDYGFNDADTNPLLLKRIMDSDDLPMDIFMGEMTGLLQMARLVRKNTVGRLVHGA